jgi:hypothetical protein
MNRYLVVALLFLASACPKPPPTGQSVTPVKVKCVEPIIDACGAQVVPLVDTCLTGTMDVVPCILEIAKAVGCATYQTLACVTRRRGSVAEHTFVAMPESSRDRWRAQRARDFLEKTGATFEDP